MSSRILRWEKHDAGTRRYYEAFVARDLLDDLVLVTRWGRIGSPLGGSQQQILMHCEDADGALARVRKQRAAHGYAPCNPVTV